MQIVGSGNGMPLKMTAYTLEDNLLDVDGDYSDNSAKNLCQ